MAVRKSTPWKWCTMASGSYGKLKILNNKNMEKQTMALIKCQECGATISDKALRCPQCGASVETVVCKECGKPIPHDALTCPHCGIPIKVAYHMGFGEAIGTCFKDTVQNFV